MANRTIRAPTVRHVSRFLDFRYGVDWDDALVGRLTGAERGDVLDMDVVIPRLADMLLDSGVIVVERPA